MNRIVFMGTPDFSVPILEQLVKDGYDIPLVVTQPDRPKGRKKVLTPPPVKVAAERLGLAVFQPEKIKTDYTPVLEAKPDLIVTAAFGQIVPNVLLEAPYYGCINVHASLLPDYRGGAPIHQAIIDGKRETGVTIMYMVEALDAGDILTQQTLPIEREDHVGSLFNKLSEVGRDLLQRTLPKLFNHTLTPTKQDESKVTYARNITRDQERIDWNKTSNDIYNHVRGMHPFPVASTTLDEKNVKLWWVETNQTHTNQAPGTIIALEQNGVVVQAGEGSVKLTDIQLAGKKRMPIKDLLNGQHPFKIGKVLGEHYE
ncbi:methionyl-tRNA formyltransferase [Halolactibacillus halophilus]|uniref:Methionyl-tRNA formyltransferase n=1 Tax=Halolactibacillus halophilus TaxID=306540 RepID=A0A1I5LPL6_9BACI|nr:methionyl-tRNA formyltransferase [Halolactibacillus halophilus]GEM00723.1 methionyl-tRNA formyltransferase [Halolactibacillus halophilus]SFO99175.1 methionyl-tRNA formyltransferase [Halolactibacillus halophilus]